MRFQISRASQGAVSTQPPCLGAVRGPESGAWPGEYEWFVDVGSLDALVRLVTDVGGGVGLFAPEEGEEHPVLQIFDDDEADD
jgi:hypothetical protein